MKILFLKLWLAVKMFFVAIYNHRKDSHLYWHDYIVLTVILVAFSFTIQKWIIMIVVISIQQLYSFIKAIQQIRQLKKAAGEEY